MGLKNKDTKSQRNIPNYMLAARKYVVEDIPSDISADEWGEINKYGNVLAREAQEK